MSQLHKQNIWGIIKRAYNMSGEFPTSEAQILLVDDLARYVDNPSAFKSPEQQRVFDKNEFEQIVQIGEIPVKRGRGRPPKAKV